MARQRSRTGIPPALSTSQYKNIVDPLNRATPFKCSHACTDCECVQNLTSCESGCSCDAQCRRRFPECQCTEACDHRCPCRRNGRECSRGRCRCLPCSHRYTDVTTPRFDKRDSQIPQIGTGLFTSCRLSSGTFLGFFDGDLKMTTDYKVGPVMELVAISRGEVFMWYLWSLYSIG